MNNFIVFLKRSFILELKRLIAYPVSFWIVTLTVPLYSLLQIAFLEIIFSQTSSFAGLTKYEGYILFGTYNLVQIVGHFFFYNKLSEFRSLVRGEGQLNFDMALIKPLDAQVSTTLGGFNFGNIVPFFISLLIIFYGFSNQTYSLDLFNIFSYIFMIILGTFIFYLTFLFFSTFLFWFPDLQMTEPLWDVALQYGQYPASLYQGALGIIFNLIVPVTLMASIPVDFLLGRIPPFMFFVYIAIILILFLFTRWFWTQSIKRYSSFSS